MATPTSRKRRSSSKIVLNLISNETSQLYKKICIPAVNTVRSTPQDLSSGIVEGCEQTEYSTRVDTPSESQSHSDRQKQLVEEWESIQERNIQFCVANQTFPLDQPCIMCLPNVVKAVIYCKDCSNIAYYCETCAVHLHERVNCYHNMLFWVVSCLIDV